MKAIRHKGTISSITAKVDGSVGYKINTPELNKEEKAAIFDLQNKNVEIFVNPFEVEVEGEIVVKKEMDTKTPSQRLRSVFFLLWKQNPEGYEVFDTYYEVKMNKYIDFLKEKLDN